tara:strand:- start:3461 stop:3601 length:141 start_codon:yes stop_codon:yes gene_type:complete
LAKELNISPSEAAKMPISLIKDLLLVHSEIETLKGEKINEMTKKVK